MADGEALGRVGAAYRAGRERITELVRDIGDEQATATVRCCPAWSIHDLLAHVTGVCADIVSGRLDGVATDPWTAAQVEARRDASMAALLDEWATTAPQVEAIADTFGPAGDQLIADLTTHEHDLRGALGAPGARDAEGVHIGLGFLVGGLHGSIAARGLPAIEIRAGELRRTVGEGEPAGTLDIEPFELFRAATGRRSATQIKAYSWTVDPEPYVAAFTFGPFTIAPADIEE